LFADSKKNRFGREFFSKELFLYDTHHTFSRASIHPRRNVIRRALYVGSELVYSLEFTMVLHGRIIHHDDDDVLDNDKPFRHGRPKPESTIDASPNVACDMNWQLVWNFWLAFWRCPEKFGDARQSEHVVWCPK